MYTTDFLRSLKRAITVPAYQARFTDTDLLELANEEQRSYLVPFITNLRENYFVVYEDSEIPGQTLQIDIPERAAARAIVDIVFKEGTSPDSRFLPIELLPVEKTWRYRENQYGRPIYYSFLADKIRLLPPPYKTGQVRIYYEELPNELVLESQGAKVVNTAVDQIVVQSIPVGWAPGKVIDITSHLPGFRPVYKSLEIVNITGLTITVSGFTALLPLTGVKAGDYLNTAKETSILHMPLEMADLLVQATALRICESRGVNEMTEQVTKIMAKKERLVAQLLTPRDKGSGKVIATNNALIGGQKRYAWFNNNTFNG